MATDLSQIFTQDFLKQVSYSLGHYIHTLQDWEEEPAPESIYAGDNLIDLLYVLGALGNHFDYFPYQYVLNDEQAEDYPDFFKKIQRDFPGELKRISQDIEKSLNAVDNVTTEGSVVQFNTWREEKHDKNIRQFVSLLQQYQQEIQELLNSAPVITDPTRPSSHEIKSLIKDIKSLQNDMYEFGVQRGMVQEAFRHVQIFEQFKLPLYLAWQLYKYGWHSDFFEEGESMFPYMSFELEAKPALEKFLIILDTQSPFSPFDGVKNFTPRLKKIYLHLHKGLKDGTLVIK